MYSEMNHVTSQFTNSVSEISRKEYVEVDEVRIFPGAVIFEGAYDMRKYEQKIVIKNCGKQPASIRITPPSSYAFLIKPQIREKFLSAGLALTRVLRYTHRQYSSILPYCNMSIYINGKCVEYKILVKISTSEMRVDPQLLDFGELNCGHTLYTRTINLINNGTKNGQFAIDLGRNPLELVVIPSKGLVKAKRSETLKVEVISNKVGFCEQDFWIKCVTPLCVKVQATFIEAKLVPYHPFTSTSYTIIIFPPTYFGTKVVKTLVVQNVSASGAMFCRMADVDGKKGAPMTFEQAEKENENFKNFQLWPKGGHLHALEGRIFQILYKPIKPTLARKGDYMENHAICVALILRIDSKDLGEIDFQGNEDRETMDAVQEAAYHFSSTLLTQDDLNENWDFDGASGKFELEMESPEVVPMGKCLRVLLYGSAQKAQVTLRPTDFQLGSIPNKETTIRELRIENVSNDLPIIFKYNKVPFVDVIPNSGKLGPLESIEVEVRVIPAKFGQVDLKLRFDLLYYNRPQMPFAYVKVGDCFCKLSFNVDFVTKVPEVKFVMGITPKNLNEVGFMTDDVRFNSSVEKPRAAMVCERVGKFRNDSELIAFPNDRPRSLRGWKKKPKCKTIFTGTPRIAIDFDEYSYTRSKENLKNYTKEFYIKFMREVADMLRKPEKIDEDLDYSIKRSKKILQKNQKPPKSICKINSLKTQLDPSFLPLNAQQLYNIVISPRRIKIEKIAAYSQLPVTITISNQNDFKIRIYLKPGAPNTLALPDGNRRVIKAGQELEIKMVYYAMGPGRTNVILDIIVNESHEFDVTLLMEVVPRYIEINCTEFEFMSDEDNIKYVELTNPSNCPLSFQWDTYKQCFVVEPYCGLLLPRKTMICQMTYTPHPTHEIASAINLVSDCGFSKEIQVAVTLVKPKVSFVDSHLVVENIPLNIPVTEYVFMKNQGMENVSWLISDPNPLPGVRIEPDKGVCPGRTSQVFKVHIHLCVLMSFKISVTIRVQRIFDIKFDVSGTVEYPKVIIKPPVLKLRRIIVGSFDRLAFLVENHGSAVSDVKFDFTEFPEFFVSEFAEKASNRLSPEGFRLKPKSFKKLFLHYEPIDVAPNKFFLPIILNGILGPALRNFVRSQAVSFYLETYEESYKQYNTINMITPPQKLLCTNVENVASFEILKFSTYDFKFIYSNHPLFHSITTKTLTIKNVSDEVVTFCIRTDDLQAPFSINFGSSEIIPRKLCLAPEDVMKVEFHFTPEHPGQYRVQLPVYLREKLEGNVFNLITLEGEVLLPTIEIPSAVYLEPVPLGVTSEKFVPMTLRYHSNDCELSSSSNAPEVYVVFVNKFPGNDSKKASSEQQVKIGFSSLEKKCLREDICIKCTCGGNVSFQVICVSENSLLTNHVYVAMSNKPILPYKLMKSDSVSEVRTLHDTFSSECSFMSNMIEKVNTNETVYPYFPEQNEFQDYSIYMYRIKSIVENWMYTQGFNGKFFYIISIGMRHMPIALDKTHKKIEKLKTVVKKVQEEKEEQLVLVQLLKNLVGNQVEKKINPEIDMPKDDAGKVAYKYSLYSNALDYLQRKGASLPHVKPEHLLEYNNYLLYIEVFVPATDNQTPITSENFESLSIQSWLDTLLQIYKIFVLSKVKHFESFVQNPSITKSGRSSQVEVPENASEVSFLSNAVDEWLAMQEEVGKSLPNIYGESEMILLKWLSFHMEKQRILLWTHEELLKKKTIRNFDSNLSDSISLIAVTISHCPYTVKAFDGIYLVPTTEDQAFHNAALLIRVWNKLNFSFKITPMDIVTANGVHMLMLVAYLYEVLPNLSPRETIYLEADLSKEVIREYVVTNENPQTICYELVFFDNDHNCFSLQTDTLIIKGRHSRTLSVKYWAKKMKKVNAVLVLTGDTQGYMYAKGMAFNLEGTPDTRVPHMELDFSLNLYETLQEETMVTSPYDGQSTYNIHVLKEEFDPYDPNPQELIPWPEIRYLGVPRILYILEDQFVSDLSGAAPVKHVVNGLLPTNYVDYVYFLDPDGGDFCIKYNISCYPECTEAEELTVELPKGYANFKCTCTNGEYLPTCPRKLEFQIPSKNYRMWDCIETLLMSSLYESERKLIAQFFGTETGANLLSWFFRQSPGPHHGKSLLRTRVTFKMFTEDPSIKFPEEVTITNVSVDEPTPIAIHITSPRIPQTVSLTMVCTDNTEYRFYKLRFL